jgi:hypothetical protein
MAKAFISALIGGFVMGIGASGIYWSHAQSACEAEVKSARAFSDSSLALADKASAVNDTILQEMTILCKGDPAYRAKVCR